MPRSCIAFLTSLGGLSVPELHGLEMPQLLRIKLPEPEAEAASRVQRHLDELARYARTFTAAAEMLSFSQQRAQAHEAQHKDDRSALGIERKNLLAEWQAIAVREGAMTLFHFAEIMSHVAASLRDCPTLSASIDQARLDTIGERFRQSFPGFKALGTTTESRPTPPLSPESPAKISFSRTYAPSHVRVHGEKNNIFQIGESMKYIARTPGSGDLVSYSLDNKSVYELREITAAYARLFLDVTDKLTPKWAPGAG
jgi:hypothetical protein